MNAQKLMESERQAKKLLERIEDVRERAKNDSRVFFGRPETAALKRASMDLTRVLSDLRRPG